ncbi:hypothetical protein BU15DRAFT_83374 [Melanogaster broomeanus]|nr:hypothetical protein BU15DRAFT_83374 [Melanogaster broomeanus]
MASGSHTRSNRSPPALDLHEVEGFRFAVWGNNDVFKRSQTIDVDKKPYSFHWLNFDKHFPAFDTLCPLIKSKPMIVRNEYRLAMETLEGEDYQGGAVVVGQPGIGKTFFLVYALVERLRKEQPTAFQFDPDMYFLFTENGITAHPTNDAQPLKLLPGTIWALSDSNEETIQLARAFLCARNARVIQATSPNAERWKEWRKQYMAHIYIIIRNMTKSLFVLNHTFLPK